MIRFQAVNDVIILVKDKDEHDSPLILPERKSTNPYEIPEPYKEVFMWRVFAELSFKQIGQMFGKSENWACVTYHRARSKIKERLGEINDEK